MSPERSIGVHRLASGLAQGVDSPTIVLAAQESPRAPFRLLFSSRAVLVLIGGLMPLLVAELLFRSAAPLIPGNYRTSPFAISSESVGRQNRPNASGWRKTDEYVTYLSINSKGLRGPEVEYVKSSDTYRILVLGDSFVFALQVAEEETFVARLPEYLPPADGYSRVETINAGTDGWSTTNEYAWLITEGARYTPDLVLLMFFVGNDPGENADRVDGWLSAQNPPGPFRDARLALAERSALYSFLEYGVVAQMTSTGTSAHEPDDEGQTPSDRREDPTRQERGWAISRELLTRMRGFSSERQIGFVVVSIPTVELVANPEWPERPLRQIADQADIPFVDVLQAFRDEPRQQQRRLYYRGNKHWTALGHDLAARTVAAELQQRGIVSTRTSPR